MHPNPNRLGPDATDNFGNPFELKTTTQNSVGTARDVSIEMIAEWKRRYWIIAKGVNLRTGFRIDSIYFLDPTMMNRILTSIEEKIRPDIQLRDKLTPFIHGKCSDEEIERFRYLMSRGATLNNPKIPWSYIVENGIEITNNYPAVLRRLVQQNPI